MKKILAILLFVAGTALAQQPLSSNSQFSYLGLNPAFTGMRGYLGVSGLIGSQFNGTIRPLPVSQIVIVDGPVGTTETHNVGFQGFNSNLGGLNSTGLNLSYAYRESLGELKISVGVDGGFMAQPNVIGTSGLNVLVPFAGFGALAGTEQAFVSVANPMFLANAERLIGGKGPWFMMAGGSLGDPEGVMVNLSSLVSLYSGDRGDGFDLNAKLWLGSRAGFGASFRTVGTVNFEKTQRKMLYSAEYLFSTSLKLGISYDPNPLMGIATNTANARNTGLIQVALLYRPVPKFSDASRYDSY